MKKIKKSLKIFISLSVVFLCVLSIVLGCVFGIKKDDPKNVDDELNSNDEKTLVSSFTPSQRLLANEINQNADKNISNFDMIDGEPFAGFCSLDSILYFGSNYFVSQEANGNCNFFTYKKVEDGFEVEELTSSRSEHKYNFVSNYYTCFVNNSNYVIFLTRDSAEDEYVDLVVVYFGEFGNPVEVFRKNSDEENKKMILSDFIIFSDEFFSFYVFDNQNEPEMIVDGVGDLFVYPLTKTKLSDEELETVGAKISNFTLSQQIFSSKSFVVIRETNKINIYRFFDGKIICNQIDCERTDVFNFTFLNSSKILLEKKVRINTDFNDKTLFEENAYYQYFYKLISFSGENISVSNIELGDGYVKIFSYDSSESFLSTSYVLVRQKTDGNYKLINEYLCTYYDENSNVVVNFESNISDKILYAGENTFLTNTKLIVPQSNSSVKAKIEFVKDEIVEGKYELYSTKMVSKVFPVRIEGGLYGLMDIDGNLVSCPSEDNNFKPLAITDNYAICQNIYADENNITLYDYYKIDLKTGEKQKINLAYDGNFNILMQNNFNGYFLFDESSETYTMFSNSLDAPIEFKNIDFITLGNGSFIRLTLLDGTKKSIKIISGPRFSFSENALFKRFEIYSNGENDSLDSNGSAGISPYALYTFNSSIPTDDSNFLKRDAGVEVDDGLIHYRVNYYAYSSTGTNNRAKGLLVKNAQFHLKYSMTNYTNYDYYYNLSRSIGDFTYDVTPDYNSTSNYASNYAFSPMASSYPDPFYRNKFSSSYGFENGQVYSTFIVQGSTLKSIELVNQETEYVVYNIELYFNETSSYRNYYKWYGLSVSSSYSSNKKVDTVYLPKKTGYTFVGYYTSRNGNGIQKTNSKAEVLNYDSVINASGDEKWYANWQISYYYISVSDDDSTYTVNFNTPVYIPNLQKPGYIFNGWQISNMSGDDLKYYGTTASVDYSWTYTQTTAFCDKQYTYFKNLSNIHAETVNFDGDWTPITYTVKFNYNNGTASTTSEFNYDAEGTLPVPTYVGYTFVGWDLSNMDSSEHIFDGSTTSSAISLTGVTYTKFKNLRQTAGEVVANAKWNASTYTISYTESGGTIPSSNPTTAVYGVGFTVEPAIRQGYTFSGWQVSNMSNDCLKYYANSASSETSTLANSTTQTTFNSTTKFFKNLRSSPGVVNFTATWTSKTYYISYVWGDEGNSSDNKVTHGIESPTSASYGTTFTISNPSWAGHIFDGWLVSGMDESTHIIGDESVTSKTYGPTKETSFKNLTSIPGNTVKFTANWTVQSYTVNYVCDGEGITTYSWLTSVKYDTMFYVQSPERIGYFFSGWKVSGMISGFEKYYSSSSNRSNFKTISKTTTSIDLTEEYTYFLSLHTNGTVTLTATWTPISYKILYDIDSDVKLASGTPDAANFDSTVSIPYPSRVGYSFLGWQIQGMGNTSDNVVHTIGSETTTESYFPSDLSSYTKATTFKNLHSIENESVTFKAYWQINSYKISYDFNGGEAGNGNFPKSANFNDYFPVDNPDIAPLGYHFIGWKLSNLTTETEKYYGFAESQMFPPYTGVINTSTKEATVNVDRNPLVYFKNLQTISDAEVLLTAVWDANTYNIEYVLQDEKGGDGNFGSNSPIYSAKYDTRFYVYNPIRTGYSFLGWNLTQLSDKCEHFFSSSATGSATSFTSINGRYCSAENPNELAIIAPTSQYLLNLHYETGKTVTLTAVWQANTYNITYHFIPKDKDVKLYTTQTINDPKIMTSTRTASARYNSTIKLLSISNNEQDVLGVQIPQEVKLTSWAMYPASALPTSYLTDADSNPLSSNVYDVGAEIRLNTYAEDVHFYAIYTLIPIKLVFFGVDNKNDINNASKYKRIPFSGDEDKWINGVGSNVFLPTEIGNSNALGLKIVGYMITSNQFDNGEFTQPAGDFDGGWLSNSSITTTNFNGESYTAFAGTTIKWCYSTDIAFDQVDPTFYLYTVYETTDYILNFVASTPSESSYQAHGQPYSVSISSSDSYKLPNADNRFFLMGYKLSGWKIEGVSEFKCGDNFTPSTLKDKLSRNVILLTVWEPVRYQIQYSLAGGTKVSGGSYPEYAYFNSVIKVSVPVKPGFILTSYSATNLTTSQVRYLGPSESELSVSSSDRQDVTRTSETGLTSDYYYKNLRADDVGVVVFVATWTPIQYNVYYNFGDGTNMTVLQNYDEWFISIAPNRKIGYTLKNIVISGISNIADARYKLTESGEAKSFKSQSEIIPVSSTQIYLYNLRNTSIDRIIIEFQWVEIKYKVNFYVNSTNDANVIGSSSFDYSVPFNIKLYVSSISTFIGSSDYMLVGYFFENMDTFTHYFNNTNSKTGSSIMTKNGTSTYIEDVNKSYAWCLSSEPNAIVKIVYLVATFDSYSLVQDSDESFSFSSFEAILPKEREVIQTKSTKIRMF